jgi:hypothetical protein
MKIAGLMGVAASLMFGAASCGDAQERADAQQPAVALTAPAAAAPVAARAPLTEAERKRYTDAAAAAWGYMERNYQPATGLVNATPDWHYTTIWDVGGQMLAFQGAKEIGLLSAEEYTKRTARVLDTLEKLELFRSRAFNKTYSTQTGSIGTAEKPQGTGWSATDLGRLLIALRVLSEREPQFADQAKRIVSRIKFNDIVQDGYLHGQLLGSKGQPWTFQEGRIGYEQYVAAGFNAWGAKVDKAMRVSTNSRPVKVLGVDLVADARKLDRLLSEPFILYGLELGMPADVQKLAKNVLAAQEARYRETKQVTIVSEDAVAVKPEYFYYYCVYCSAKPFVVDVSSPGNVRDDPRWVSTKGAFGWNAIMPSEYTKLAMEHVMPALDPKQGWASGIYEKTGKSTATFDINTAAVMLEVAAFELRGGKPLIQAK